MLESIEKLREWRNVPANGYWADEIIEHADAIEREVSERYMLVPVDADGVPIRVGDELQDANGVKVIAECVGSDGFCANGAHRNGWCNYRHVKPRTVTDVLADLFDRKMSVTDAEHELRDLLGGDA